MSEIWADIHEGTEEPARKKVEVVINITPEEMEDVFWKMDQVQAEFFNHLGHISYGKLDNQLSYVSDSTNANGCRAMMIIGDHA